MSEVLVGPELAEHWTSERELDRLRALLASLGRWAEVYERWRHHELAGARPAQPGFGTADLAAVGELGGIHFGQLTAAARRWRDLAAAASRLADSYRSVRAGLADAWRGDAASRPLRELDELRRVTADCAARCERIGLQLEIAIGDTAVPVLRDAVDEILTRSRGLERPAHLPEPRSCLRMITELERVHRGGAGSGGWSAQHLAWRDELDGLVVDYDAVIALLRADLRAARNALTAVYESAREALAAPQAQQADSRWPAGAGRPAAGEGPATTALASADASGAASASSAAGNAGGGGAPGSGAPDDAGTGVATDAGAGARADPGSARLGELGDLDLRAPEPDGTGARLASVSDELAGCGPAAVGASPPAATGGATGGVGLGDQRTSRPRPGGGDR